MYSRTQEGSGALRRPGLSRHRASPWAAPVPPTERAGSEGSMYAACGSAPFGGWRHHLSPSCAGGTMGAERWRQVEFMAAEKRKPYNRASPGRKQANLAALAEMHPFCRLSAASLHGKASHAIFRSLLLPYKSRSLATPEGEICSPLSFWTHKYLKA